MILDGKLIKKDGHKYLIEVLDLPVYYGENLDALFDCLCEMECEIHLINADELDSNIIETFKDASLENNYLKLKIDN